MRSSVVSLRAGNEIQDQVRRRGYAAEFCRGWRRVFAAVMALVVAFGVVTARLFVWPAQGMPARVSAIVMLAGPVTACPWHCSWPGSIGRRCWLSRKASTGTGARARRRRQA